MNGKVSRIGLLIRRNKSRVSVSMAFLLERSYCSWRGLSVWEAFSRNEFLASAFKVTEEVSMFQVPIKSFSRNKLETRRRTKHRTTQPDPRHVLLEEKILTWKICVMEFLSSSVIFYQRKNPIFSSLKSELSDEEDDVGSFFILSHCIRAKACRSLCHHNEHQSGGGRGEIRILN